LGFNALGRSFYIDKKNTPYWWHFMCNDRWT